MAEKYKVNAAISSIYVGEHKEKQAKYVASWMTKHLENKTPSSEFDKLWKKFEDDEEMSAPDLLRKRNLVENLSELEFEAVFPNELYKIGIENKANRFITFDNNAYIDIVAIRGHPAGKDIAALVLGKENIGEWTDKDTIEYLGKGYPKQK